jgi:predicted adenine nucleotide alpha hydrolase (AANH) superfamily ATPase
MLSSGILEDRGRILLLVCCAPCCCSAVEFMAENKVDATLLFYNPNIYPEAEYEKRKAEVVRIAGLYGVPFVDADYSPEDYVRATVGFGACPERGPRCGACFLLRLMFAAKYAQENGFDCFASTLGFSRFKDSSQVDAAGAMASASYGVPYLDIDWKSGVLPARAAEIIREQKIYRQRYCGCIYSKKA